MKATPAVARLRNVLLAGLLFATVAVVEPTVAAAGVTITVDTTADDASLAPSHSATVSPACTITWEGGSLSNLWNHAQNWLPRRVPSDTDRVCIPVGVTPGVVFDSGTTTVMSIDSGSSLSITGGTLRTSDPIDGEASQLADLELSGGTLHVQQVFLSGGLTWTGGIVSTSQSIHAERVTISGPAAKSLTGTLTGEVPLRVDTDATLDIEGSAHLGVIDVAGEITGDAVRTRGGSIAESGTISATMLSIGGGFLEDPLVNRGRISSIVSGEGTLDNRATVQMQGDDGPGELEIHNEGTLSVPSASYCDGGGFVLFALDNDGVIDISQGCVLISEGVGQSASSGEFRVAKDATLRFGHYGYSFYALDDGASFTGGGSVVTRGPMRWKGDIRLLDHTSFTFNYDWSRERRLGEGLLADARLLGNGQFKWWSGRLLGPGTFELGPGITTILPQLQAPVGDRSFPRVLTDHLVMRNEGLLRVEGTGQQLWHVPLGTGSYLENLGSLERTAEGTTTLPIPIVNRGSFDVGPGILELPDLRNSGTLQLGPSSDLRVDGDYTEEPTATMKVATDGTPWFDSSGVRHAGRWSRLTASGEVWIGGDLVVEASGDYLSDAHFLEAASLNGSFKSFRQAGTEQPTYGVRYGDGWAGLFIAADKEPPTGLTLEADRPTGEWFDSDLVAVKFSGATDAWSGVAGYSVTLDSLPEGAPDDSIDPIPFGPGRTYYAHLPEGPSNYLHVRAIDHTGNAGETVTLGPFMSDTSNPENIEFTSHDVQRKYQDDRSIDLAWTSSSDAFSGLAPYVVSVSRAPDDPDKSWSYQTIKTDDTTVSIPAEPGRTYCIRIEPLDLVGNEGFGPYACTTVPIDDTKLDSSPEWDRVRGSGYYLNGASVTDDRGATIVRRSVRARRLAAMVTTCPNCGRLVARFKGRVVARVDLSSKRRRTKRIIELAAFSRNREGQVRITVVSRRQRVEVDGFGAWRDISS